MKHFKRIQLWWLMAVRKLSGASDVDFDRMSLDDYLGLVPDQADHVTGLGALGIQTCGDLARVLRAPPMLSTCILFQLGPVIKQGNDGLLRDARNLPALGALVIDHTKKYHMPPSPHWLAMACADKLKSDAIRDAGSASTGLGDADGGKKKAAGGGEVGAEKKADGGEKAAGGEREADGAVEENNRVAAPQRIKWWLTEKASSNKIRCACTGNCHGNCPARKKDNHCPNKKVDGLDLCSSCICRVPGCSTNARRAYGKWCFPENRAIMSMRANGVQEELPPW